MTPRAEHSSATCPLCSSQGLALKYPNVRDRLGFVQGRFDFHVCRRCSSVSLVPLPEEEEVGSFYPPAYMVTRPAADGGLSGVLRRLEWRVLFLPVYRAGAKAVIEMAGSRAGRLLEIGCSSGYQLAEFGKLGEFEAYGVDIDGAAVNHARQELGLNVIHGSLAEADFPDSYFDIVILFNVLEHLVNPLVVLAEVNRILKPHGYLAIKTPMIDSLQGRLLAHRWVMLRDVPRHVLLPSGDGIQRLLARAGLRLAGQRGGPRLENGVSVAVSIMPDATSARAFERRRLLGGYLHRLAGTLVGVVASPLVFIESLFGLSGTMIYVARKAGAEAASVRA